ncbi:MAG: polymerase epsilon subunit [Pseudomonadota bacterium]|jgi:DNA polymerase-3 subunit epsilon
MFKALKKKWALSRLKDDRYRVLFDEAPQDEWVSYDCETTGLNPKTAEIVSIGAVIIKNNVILSSKKFYALAKTTGEVSEASVKAHHIRNIDLEDARPIKEVIDEFIDFVGGRKLVGYFLEFDIAMVNKYLNRYGGISLPNYGEDISALYFDYKIDPLGTKNVDLKFDSIMKELRLPILGQHNSYQDALMTALAFVKLKNH